MNIPTVRKISHANIVLSSSAALLSYIIEKVLSIKLVDVCLFILFYNKWVGNGISFWLMEFTTETTEGTEKNWFVNNGTADG